MSSDIANDVAADMLGQAASMGMQVSDSAQEALSEAPEPVEAPSVEETPTAAESLAEEIVAESDDKFPELPAFKPIPDEEFAAFGEVEAEAEIAELREVLDVEDGYSEIEDADELRARLHNLEKQLNYQKDLRAKSERKNWETEAKERYPLANVGQINAKSRNAFMKAAAQSHNDVYKHLEPHWKQIEEMRKQARAEGRAEAKQDAIEAWGTPTGQPTVGEIDETTFQSGLQEVRKSKDLAKVLRYIREAGR